MVNKLILLRRRGDRWLAIRRYLLLLALTSWTTDRALGSSRVEPCAPAHRPPAAGRAPKCDKSWPIRQPEAAATAIATLGFRVNAALLVTCGAVAGWLIG
jgi:hypothetical protein